MCAFPEGFVAPDFGLTLRRQRVLDAVASHGARPCLFFGHSGAGKSVAVAHAANSLGSRTIWIDGEGRGTAASKIVKRALRCNDDLCAAAAVDAIPDDVSFGGLLDILSRVLRCSPHVRLCLVLDDLGEIPDDRDASELTLLGKTLWHAGSRLMVTTRTLTRWSPGILKEWGLIGPDTLQLTVREGEQLLELIGPINAEAEAITLLDACGGNVALYVLLARQSRSGVYEAVPQSLDAWLGYVIENLDHPLRELLFRASCLRTGLLRDLGLAGQRSLSEIAQRLNTELPLFRITSGPGISWSFRVHDAVDSYWRRAAATTDLVDAFLPEAVAQLSQRGDSRRALELLMRWGEDSSLVSWLSCYGATLLQEEQYSSLEEGIESLPISSLMTTPRLLLLWAELLAATGRLEDGLAKCRAARTLAEHDADGSIAREAIALSLVCLRQLGRLSEANGVAEHVIAQCTVEEDPRLLAQALVNLGYSQMVQGESTEAKRTIAYACEVADRLDQLDWVAIAARHAWALLPGSLDGDFRASDLALAPLESHVSHLNSNVAIRGNMGVALMQLGRLARSETLLASTILEAKSRDHGGFASAYLPTLGCAVAASGRVVEGVGLAREAIAIASDANDQSNVNQARVYLSTILRAAGDNDGALVEAERAFERLSVDDQWCFRRLAALEVSASLLALGDLSAARTWAEGVIKDGFSGNRYHALRADMIVAEIERREGREAEALERLSQHADYILSENPNWQIGMYCRTFPHLLGLVTKTVGARRLPSHLLRIVLPEYAERVLLECHSMLADDEWRELGMRLLGDTEFEKLVARNGQPLCRVRLFGGLEVSIGGRAIQERDWKKRKVRLLFIMLVSRRGHDVPRDQICERLWPEMDEKQATSNFYVTWSLMKSALGAGTDKNKPSPYVESVGGLCRIVRSVVSSDIDEFEDSLKRAREAEAAGDSDLAIRSYQRVADIYRGHLLPGDCYDDWFADLRAYYRNEFVDAMLGAAGILAASGDRGNALVYLRRAVQADPYREDLYQRTMRAQIDGGMRSAAIETYFQCRERISDELGLDPSVETQVLYREILAMESRPLPALDGALVY